jgi:hypothetical protein
MAIDPTKILHGARTKFKIRGQIVAYANNAQYNKNYAMSPINAIGDLEVLQHIMTAYTVSLSCSQVRVVDQSFVKLGFLPKVGQSSAQHLTNVAQLAELDATVEDSITGALIASFIGLRVESESTGVGANGLVTCDFTFVCRRYLSEEET